MIQIRDTFQVKFGKIDQAVEHWKAFREQIMADLRPDARMELLTDLSGMMYTLIAARHLESLAHWEQARTATFAHPKFHDWYKPFQQLVEDGSRDFFNMEQGNEGWSGPGAVVIRSCFRALEWRIQETVELLQSYGAMLVDCGVATRPRILTDASGRMFNVVIEAETHDLKTWDTHRKTMFRDAQFQVWFRRLLTCVSHGSHEFYAVVG
ncbi:MAG: hypothetical protein AB1449_11825 [Chloroflexota bacterium]